MTMRGSARQYPGVMVSSSFVDLARHRQTLIEAINGTDAKPIAMEHDSAKADVDVIESSLRMVDDCAAYCGVIGQRYGQTPVCSTRNPHGLSLTHLEFLRARDLGKPILLFVMGDDHPLTVNDVELDPDRRALLAAFRTDAKRMRAESQVERVYAVFESLEEFRAKALQAVAELVPTLGPPDPAGAPAAPAPPRTSGRVRIAPVAAPDLWAVPRYAGSHRFVGRTAELDALDDWARPENPHPVLLFEAIGGTGKSMLGWHWTTTRAPEARDDWAGRLWYSFYERGAEMTDFLRHVLAYTTGQSVDDVTDIGRADLADAVLAELQARPWLVVLDGVERILVAYHRLDAAQVADEDAGETDEADRDVRDAIIAADDELLRSLATSSPSKLLLTTRIVPRSMLNRSGQAIPGVRHERLSGLRPPDAELLLRACDVAGTSDVIRTYLAEHCDCHPLVVGVLAGLVRAYLPARGDFDRWAADPHHGGQLDLGRLDLVQKRNHILTAAIDALDPTARELLSTLALLSDAADLDLLRAVNPHRDAPAAEQLLTETILDLEGRSLLQTDRVTGTYDLHPVVRGVAFGSLDDNEVHALGRRVVDHFSAAEHPSYDKATSLDDLRVALNLVRANMQIGRYDDAVEIFGRDLREVLITRVPSMPTVIALLGPLFPDGWTGRTLGNSSSQRRDALRVLCYCLMVVGREREALDVAEAQMDEAVKAGKRVAVLWLGTMSLVLQRNDRFAHALAIADLVDAIDGERSRSDTDGLRLAIAVNLADHDTVDELYEPALAAATTPFNRAQVMALRARSLVRRGELEAHHMTEIEAQLTDAGHPNGQVWFESTRGEWHFFAGRRSAARQALEHAVTLGRRSGMAIDDEEAFLAYLAVVDGLPGAIEQLVRLDPPRRFESIYFRAMAWWLLGHRERAADLAEAAHRVAAAEGEPYVKRDYLQWATDLLEEIGAPVPEVPPYDPAGDPPYAWEAEILERYGPEPGDD